MRQVPLNEFAVRSGPCHLTAITKHCTQLVAVPYTVYLPLAAAAAPPRRSTLWAQLETGLLQVAALEHQAATAVAAADPAAAACASCVVDTHGFHRAGALQRRHAATHLGAVQEGGEECAGDAGDQQEEVVIREDADAAASIGRAAVTRLSIQVEGLECAATATAAAATSSIGRCYSRTRSIGRAACAELPPPRGLGDVPLTPSGGGSCGGSGGALGARVGSATGAAAFGRAPMFLRGGRGRGSSIVAAALPAAAMNFATVTATTAAGAASAACNSCGVAVAAAAGAQQHPHPHHHHHSRHHHHHHHHNVAFAVGLAAATTANAAVNSVGDLAVAGLSAVASTALLGAVSSAALQQLGPHALAAGSNMLVNRIQVRCCCM